MKGSYHIIVQNRALKYEFNIRRNPTIIQGNSATGKTKIFDCLLGCGKMEEVLAVADGAAFASQMNRLAQFIGTHKVHLYLPESFEWLLLKSGIISDSSLKAILDNPSDYIESSLYFSWERFFTALIVQKTKDSYLQYKKSKLNRSYLQRDIKERILSQIKGITFTKKKDSWIP